MLVGFVLLASASPLLASPATFVTALPVALDQWLIRFNAQPSFGGGLTAVQFPVTNAFGITSRWAFFLNLNQGFTSLAAATVQPTLDVSTGGSGDSLAFLRYTLFRIDRPLSTLRIAPLAGVSIPTGSNSLEGPQGLLPGSLQTGTGTFDPYVGVTTGYNNPHWGWAADTTFRHNTKAAAGYTAGNTFRADAQFEVIMYPPFTSHIPEEGLPKEIVISFESNYEQDGRASINRMASPNSGGKIWKQNLILELGTLHGQVGGGVELPVLQDLPGTGRATQRLGFYLYYERYLAIPRSHGRKNLQ